MKPTVQQVKDQVRQELGDLSPGGEVFTDHGDDDGTVAITKNVKRSYEVLYRGLEKGSSPFLRAEQHYILRQGASFLDPSTAYIDNLGEPRNLYFKRLDTEINLANLQFDSTDRANPFCEVTTVSNHGFNDDTVVVMMPRPVTVKDPGQLEREWTIRTIDPTKFRLLNCIADGTYTTGGAVAVGSERWGPMNVERTDGDFDLDVGPQWRSGDYLWRGDQFLFRPLKFDRLLKIVHTVSANLPDDDTYVIPFDDSLGFLSKFAAAMCAEQIGDAMGGQTKAGGLYTQAVGNPTGNTFNPTGELGSLLDISARAQQRVKKQFAPYRLSPAAHFKRGWPYAAAR